MLNAIIQLSLRNRLLVAVCCVFLVLFGGWRMMHLPIDVFPDLNRPRVVVLTEAHGMAPEEVETLITFPLETALNGAPGVQDVRSTSGVGMSVVYVEFDWGTDIYNDRQVVAERLALAGEQLPDGVSPQLAPVSSIMGQIMIIGMYSRQTEATRIFQADIDVSALNDGDLPDSLNDAFLRNEVFLSTEYLVEQDRKGDRWYILDHANDHTFAVIQTDHGVEVHRGTSPMQLRTYGDWLVRQRLLTIPGVSQVFVMGGGRKQFQVLVDPDLLLRYGVTLHEVKNAVESSNENATGGYLDEQGPNELLVRALGRIQSAEALKKVVVKHRDGRSIYLGQVAQVKEGAQVKRGDSAAFERYEDRFVGGSALALTVNKQPQADTRQVTQQITEALATLQSSLPNDVRIAPDLYQQSTFIDLAIENVQEALRDGGVLVLVILFIFLLNFRTTFITLTAIPLSIVVTSMVFLLFDLSINTMTLGGLAVAIGELVDDAIVDVENIFRRLKENQHKKTPLPKLLVVFRASVEVRNSIVFGTMIVVLVFIPLFFLSGMEGRLFTPLGIAYIVSIVSSLLVSLTLTPVLSYWLLAEKGIWPYVAAPLCFGSALAISYFLAPIALGLVGLAPWGDWILAAPWWMHLGFAAILAPLLWLGVMWADRFHDQESEGAVLRGLKWLAGGAIRTSLKAPAPIIGAAVIVVGVAGVALSTLEQDFLPPFNEGSVQINVILPPGASLATSNRIAGVVEERLQQIPELQAFVRKTGRAELDEHAEGVNVTEIIASLDPHSTRTREQILDDIRHQMEGVPGIVTSVEQPLAHLISHMVSGVKAQVAIKLYGDDLDTLRQQAEQIKAAMASVEGVTDPLVEPQTLIPQLRIEVDGDRLQTYGLTRRDVNEFVSTAMNGEVVSQVLDGQRTFDLVVRMDEPFREDLQTLKRLQIDLPDGGVTTLDSVANIYLSQGPNLISREKVRRRIVVQCNTSGRGLVDVVSDIQQRVKPIEASLPEGYFIEYSGQFESQQSASRAIYFMFGVSLIGMFLVLFTLFRSVNLSLQVMAALPMAFIGSVAALLLTGQTLTIASMVGFISLCGIASRNGILLITHYLHLVQHEGEEFTPEMIVRAGKERLAPVLMTALTSGIGLAPLAIAAGEPGKEILFPVATVIIGGLISSTLLEFFVRPALFWSFGRKSAERVLQSDQDEVALTLENKPTEDAVPDHADIEISD